MRPDLVTDFRRVMVEVLPVSGAAERSTFAALDVAEQAWRFLNWESRLVPPHPRRVFRAVGLEGSPSFRVHRTEVNLLLAKIAAGLDVKPHLSRGIRRGFCIRSAGRKDGPDFDLILNEWAIHHFHLSHELDEDGFVRRGDALLFAIVLPGEVFALAVGTHQDWTAPRLVEEVVRSWPERRSFVPLDVMPGSSWTPEEHRRLRKSGLLTPSLVDGRMHYCGLTLGLTTALVSTAMSREGARVLRGVWEAQRNPSSALSQLREEAEAAGLAWPRRPRLRVVRGSGPTRWGFGFLEERSGATLLI